MRSADVFIDQSLQTTKEQSLHAALTTPLQPFGQIYYSVYIAQSAA